MVLGNIYKLFIIYYLLFYQFKYC